MALSQFLDMLDRLRDFLKQRSDRLESEKNQVDQTLAAVNLAANHTRAYLADWRSSDESRDRKIERELSDEWVEVGTALRKIDAPEAKELYKRCFMKAKYWSDPDGWDKSLASDMDIRLEQVLADAQNAIE